MKDFDLGSIEGGSGSIDSFLEPTPKEVRRVKVAHLSQLDGFTRIAADTLVHKSNQDLWSLEQAPDGSYFIERKFDTDGDPLKG